MQVKYTIVLFTLLTAAPSLAGTSIQVAAGKPQDTEHVTSIDYLWASSIAGASWGLGIVAGRGSFQSVRGSGTTAYTSSAVLAAEAVYADNQGGSLPTRATLAVGQAMFKDDAKDDDQTAVTFVEIGTQVGLMTHGEAINPFVGVSYRRYQLGSRVLVPGAGNRLQRDSVYPTIGIHVTL